MRRPAVIAVGAVIVVLLGMTAALYQKYQKSTAELAALTAAETTARGQYADAFSSIAEIQDSLDAITLGDSAMQFVPERLQTEQLITGPSRQEVLDRIAVLNASIQRTKGRISQLEASLRQSGIKTAGMQRMITTLKQTVAEKETAIADLTTRVDALQTQVTGLETTVQENRDTLLARDQTIADKQRELGTIYYIIGTKKELATSGVIVAKGGVLGLGKTLQLSGRYDENHFTALDTDQQTVVHTPSAKVQVLSPQPISSYELTTTGKQIELHIIDPREFRKVKHLVIMTG